VNLKAIRNGADRNFTVKLAELPTRKLRLARKEKAPATVQRSLA
jgi:hypothetical protein